ncbi:MAG: hypothetical protein CMN74_02215 [Sphingorhabdus sp.]|nr:hypothetical protein [Sphingorhabdus sp.]|tara:strand:- start:863 stop:1225 length:363 start_codon:yes stop_codon:yes gene_type:complete
MKNTEQRSRGRLTLSGVSSSNPGTTSNAPANSNTSPSEEAETYRAAMTDNAKRNEIMLAQIVKPHMVGTNAADASRIESICTVIGPIVVQQQLNAEQIVDLALFTNKVLPGERTAMRKAA